MTGVAPREEIRQIVHVSMAGFALFLRWIPWWAAALMAVAALVLNATWIPRALGGRLMRVEELRARLTTGVVFYALAVLLLVLIFRHRLEIAACAWGILAFGDGASTLFGRGLGGPRLPWNRAKTWAGSVGFLLAGTVGGGALMIWVAGRAGAAPLSAAKILLLACCGAIVGAVMESLPSALNDNLSVPLLAGGVVGTLLLVDPIRWSAAAPEIGRNLLTGLPVILVFAGGAKLLGTVSWSGVAGGIAVGLPIFVFAGWKGFAVLAAFFVLGSAATRLGYGLKATRGIAQAESGARGLVHAVANGGVAAYLAFLAGATRSPLSASLLVAMVAALATAACDTLGSEIGPLARGRPYLIIRGARVAAGTPGAVSLLGTAAGAAGALIVGGVAVGLQLIPPGALPVVLIAALFGAFLESLLAATLEPKGLIDSETMNFVNTLAGALASLGLIRIGGAG